jgi:hypothetical protein
MKPSSVISVLFKSHLALALLCATCLAAAATSPPLIKVQPFDLREVRLLDGPFKHAMERDRQYLLSLDPDRLLHSFRVNAGLPSSAQPLGGWEEPKSEVRGHFLGHFLSACALMYASTGDARLKEKANTVVAGLAECQAKTGAGYLSAFPEEFFDRVEAQKRVWAPYYTLHKIYAGLLDVHVYCGHPQALAVCKKFADWVIARNARLSDEQMQKMLGNEHGGMNEVLANLYGLTGEERYLKIAQRFNHLAVIGPAAKREDRLTGLHANTQIPKFVGAARQYELTGEDWLKTASIFFWNTVVKERSYVIGGHSDGEMFTPKERLSQAFGPNTTETCNTYNMLKLTRRLFCWEPKAEYADYYERALLNHILSSQDPETGMTCYYVPLQSGSRKEYCEPTTSFWCCTGTGVENHAKYGDSIYFHEGGQVLYLNLFIASELDWKARGIKVRQETTMPDGQESRLTFTCERPAALAVKIRYPAWAQSGFKLEVNGQAAQPEDAPARQRHPGAYLTISREWKTGDQIALRLAMDFHTEGFADNSNRLAFLRGPAVLSAEVDPKKPAPVFVPGERYDWRLVPGQTQWRLSPGAFRIPGAAEDLSLTLEPFYKMHGRRPYAVYFDRLSPAQWQVKQAEFKAEDARRQELDARTVDLVNPGEEQNERDHKVQGERTGTGGFGDRHYRHATEGGWFSWQVKARPGQAQELQVTYWGSDGGNRVFDVLVDGVKLTTQRLQNNKPGKFYEETYLLPTDLTKDKDQLTVKFQAHPGAWAGGVFGLRVTRPAAQ